MKAKMQAVGYQRPTVPWNGLTVTDLFCGAGGSSSGLVEAGYKVVIAANHWQLAIESHQINHPDTDHSQADISQVDPRYFPRTHVLWGSPECFPAGHLVTTLHDGQKPIEEIQLGDMVLTHTGRFMPVVRTQSKIAEETVVVRGQGHTGIEMTPNHSLWARESGRVWQTNIRQYRREYAEPEWIRAEAMLEREALWSTPVKLTDPRDALWRPLEHIAGGIFGTRRETIAYLLGRWLGDGSVGKGRSTDVTISCSFDEADELGEILFDTLGWHRDVKRTAVNFRIGSAAARAWFERETGVGAGNKQLPTWVLFWPEELRRAVLRGYLDSDGGETQRRVRASTVSHRLAISIRLLAESLGHRVAMAHDKRTEYEIEGRKGIARQQWILHWEPQLSEGRSPEAFEDGIHAWSRVRAVEPARKGVRVYNIEVAEDHSYVLDGIVVKNCTNHSIAKGVKRQRQQDQALFELDGTRPLPDEAANRSRATMWDIPRFAEHHRYMAIILENVVDAYRWDQFPAWQMAMEALGYRMQFVWLNSMHAQIGGLPAPQSRDRMYIVMWRADLVTSKAKGPNVAKWTRPMAFCAEHGQVQAVQAFKKAEQWGRYRAQYLYRCPECWQIIEPGWLPASSIIDWSIPVQRIGDREKPLAEKTRERIRRGIERYWAPVVVKAAGNTYDGVTTGSNYLRVSELDTPLPVQTGTAEHGMAIPPFLSQFRERDRNLPVSDPLNSAPISLDVDDAGFRMLEPHEIQLGMGFAADYLLLGSKRDKVKQAGNAVTPPAARDLGHAVAEFLLAVAA